MWNGSRRNFIRMTAGAFAASRIGYAATCATAQAPAGQRPRQDDGVKVLNPQMRVPLSFIIDDSTCLVNMGYYCTPQFNELYPDREEYQRPWKKWPREIPDAFVREFGEWCAQHGVKGKYSVVPYPACVGWLDRELPGWSRRELQSSLKLVRELMLPSWDIHPEMITHTRVIDLKTGRPLAEISPATMENSYPREKRSVDELAAYLAYALRVLKNCELPCEGITTPGGFGNLVKSELSLAVQQAVRDVFMVDVPHYFKYVNGGNESTQPKLEHVSGLDTDNPRITVNVPAGTDDWFGGWQGDNKPEGFRYSNEDATKGRMVELIERGAPAVMLCHWAGMYCHGSKSGFEDFKKIVLALEGRFSAQTIWMKVSEIARYWAAKELTQIERNAGTTTLHAPFASPRFTVQLTTSGRSVPTLIVDGKPAALRQVERPDQLKPQTWLREQQGVVVCFDLLKGKTVLNA